MKFAELIPQVFFDAIARVAAGLVLLAGITALWRTELKPLLPDFKIGFEAAPATITMSILVFAYVLAIGFEGTRDALRGLRKFIARLKIVGGIVSRLKKAQRAVSQLKIVRILFAQTERTPLAGKPRETQWTEAWTDFSEVFPNEVMDKPPRPSDAIAIDVIRMLNPAVGSRIVKLRAEVALCRTLSAGGTVLILGLIFHVFLGFTFFDTSPNFAGTSLISIILVAFVARMFGNRQRSLDGRQLRALYNHWLLLVCPGAPGMSDSSAASERSSTGGLSAFFVPYSELRKDTQRNMGGKGYRKLVVPEIYPSAEMPATRSHWQAPGPEEKGHVLCTSNVEVSVFSNIAPQKRHFHKLATEIYCVVDGEMEIEVNEETYKLRAGDMIVVAPYAIHEVRRAEKPFLCQVVAGNCFGKQDKYVAPPLTAGPTQTE